MPNSSEIVTNFSDSDSSQFNMYFEEADSAEMMSFGDVTVNAGGGGGVENDYEYLINKPSINGVPLRDNKTFEDLGLRVEDFDIDVDQLGLEQDPDTYYVYPTYKGVRSEQGIPLAGGSGGGGGGGDIIHAQFSVTNLTEWLSTTIVKGGTCPVRFQWSSIEDGQPTGDGKGTARITVDNIVKGSLQIMQGDITIDLGPYLTAGTNKVKVRISDVYDQGRTIAFSVTSVDISIQSTFEASAPFTDAIPFPFTPYGENIEKNVRFIVDGVQIGNRSTTYSGRQLTYTIPAQSSGAHSLRVYFDAVINEEEVRSNELYYEFISLEEGSTDTVIISSFNKSEVSQYTSVVIPFRVYNPNTDTAEVNLYVNNALVSTQTVDRAEHSYTVRANNVGTLSFKIESGGQTKTISMTVTPTDIDVQAETEDLVLYLNALNKDNTQENWDTWAYNGISATFSNFNKKLDGWQKDDNGINVLRLVDNARVEIPYQIFGSDFKTTGKTIEIEFSSHDVADYTSTIISCFADGIGLKITPQKVMFSGAQTSTDTLYKDNEHVRLSIVISKQASYRLILIYINGIMSRAIQYASGERFSQTTPVGISIGSNDCGVDIYCIRVYDNDLNREQILDNWIADTQVGSVMLERYTHNNVYDAYGNITVATLPNDLPYMIIESELLPQYKGDNGRPVSGSYTDPVYPSKSFTFENVKINVQGTSSAPYFRKNYDMQFKNGFITPAGTIANYALRTGSIPFNRFVLKADVASSESANNTQLTMFFNDTCPYKTPEMLEDSRVRWGIEGIPIALFWYDTTNQTTQFMGKYNFNLPKRAPEPYGYANAEAESLESWEVERNDGNNVRFKDNDFETQIWDEDAGVWKPEWYDDFEARFPSDTWRDTAQLNEFLVFTKSTNRDAATGDALDSPVTFRLESEATITPYQSTDNSFTSVAVTSGGAIIGYDITFTKDTPAYRLSKFKAEFEDYAELESAIFYYLFTELFLMIDSRAKNLFVGFNGSPINDPNRLMRRKATFQPYDMDTAIGINNSGVLAFGYSLEDTDTLENGAPVFNAQDSALWCNVRDSYRSDIIEMYRSLRSGGGWSYEVVRDRFTQHQSKWPEAVFNEDAYVKYLTPLLENVTFDEDTGQWIKTDRYLTMLQGSKEEQRKWWLYNRFKYMDSKFLAGSAQVNISARFFNAGTLTVTPVADCYVNFMPGGGVTRRTARASANQPVSFVFQPEGVVTEKESYIYSADLIGDLGDLSVFNVNELNLSRATRLKHLKLGDSSPSYSNDKLQTFDVSNSPLLETIDCRNCPNLNITVNLERSSRLQEAYFDGTSITGVELADGCLIETLHLPSTITALTLLNLTNLEELVCPSFAKVSRLMLDSINTSIVNPVTILQQIKPGSLINIRGFYLEMATTTEIDAFFDLLDTMGGVSREKNDQGEWIYREYPVGQAQVSGEIHTSALTGAEIAAYNARYQYLRVTADHTSAILTYKTYDGSSTIATETILDGGNGTRTNNTQRTATAQYTYTPNGWATTPNGARDANALANVSADRTVYAAYTQTVRTYTVYFYNGTTLLQTVQNVAYGSSATYTGSTPVNSEDASLAFLGWSPQPTNITGNTSCYAQFESAAEVVEITDSWSDIFAAEQDGTYSTKYSIGDTKEIDLGEKGKHLMEIVAFDTDDLADGTGKAKITWMLRHSSDLLKTTAENSASYYKWETSTYRQYLRNTILPLFPSDVSSGIKEVTKVTRSFTSASSSANIASTTTDTIWAPSGNELKGTVTNEKDVGVYYSTAFPDDNSRIKTRIYNGNRYKTNYLTRSAYTYNSAFEVYTTGALQQVSMGSSDYAIFGFCT